MSFLFDVRPSTGVLWIVCVQHKGRSDPFFDNSQFDPFRPPFSNPRGGAPRGEYFASEEGFTHLIRVLPFLVAHPAQEHVFRSDTTSAIRFDFSCIALRSHDPIFACIFVFRIPPCPRTSRGPLIPTARLPPRLLHPISHLPFFASLPAVHAPSSTQNRVASAARQPSQAARMVTCSETRRVRLRHGVSRVLHETYAPPLLLPLWCGTERKTGTRNPILEGVDVSVLAIDASPRGVDGKDDVE